MEKTRLIFIYNADSGLFNTVTDIAHKVLSPNTYSCDLCALTHGYFSMRDEWRQFLEGLPVECEFLHRDQLDARYPALAVTLPAILREDASGVSVCLDAEAIGRCSTIEALKGVIAERCLLE